MEQKFSEETIEFISTNSEFISAHVPQNEYNPGTAAPKLPELEPKQTPEVHQEPEVQPVRQPKPKQKRPSYAFSSIMTILGIVTVAACAFFLLSREVTIQEQKNSILDIKERIEELYVERDDLNTKYNAAIDIDAIFDKAMNMGMHAPEDGQLVTID
ncbi:MAG: hypothetical protein J6L92_05110 [Clostridia bacterium]|nr:hypothetical protein [Clostridia bacterium]